MKGAVFALFCAVALVHAEINEKGCPINPAVDVLLPHPNCNKYYQCSQGDLLERNCGANLVFNVETQECDWAEKVDCENRVPAVPDSSEEDNKPGNDGGNNDPSKAPEICAAQGSEGVLVAHENCNQFYECNNGAPVAHRCASNLLFNPSSGECDWPKNVNCGDRNPDGGSGGGGNGEGGNGDSNSSESNDRDSSESSSSDSTESGNNGGANSDPSEAQKICAAEGSDGVLVAHENCNQYYKCDRGRPVAMNCWGNLLFNPANDQCDWPEKVNCGDRNPDGGSGGGGNGEGGNGDSNSSESSNRDSSESDNNGGANSDPSEAWKICAGEGSDGVLVAHENCNQYYKCDRGRPVAMNCWGNLLFNPANDQCDWPEKVNCGDRNPDGGSGGGGNGEGGNGDSNSSESSNRDSSESDNNGGANSDPSEAWKICAGEGSDGVLVAHENCNQYYKCDRGRPVAMNCWGNLLFNPANDQCDWPDKVNCGDRNPDGGSGGGGNGEGGNGDSNSSESNDRDSSESSSSDSTESGNNGGANSDPSEAWKICAGEGSDGVLVAHENCNQYYKCDRGRPVAMNCWGNLLFNPANDQCDWPYKVNCGDRNSDVGAGDIDSEENGNGGSDNEGSDNGGNDNEDSDNNGGNSDPSQAKLICAAEDSEDVLVAHENCNLFYICNGGEPVVRKCSGELVFNPSKNQCDWPQNVDCGNRNRAFTSFNKHMRRFNKA